MVRGVYMHKRFYESIDSPVEELAMLVFNHFGKTPMNWTGIDKLTEYAHNEQFVNRVFQLYDYLSSNDHVFEGINPSQYYKIIYKYQLASKSLPYESKIIERCYFFLANYAIRLYNYNIDIITRELPRKKIVLLPNTSINKTRNRISMLSALLRSFSEALYCDEHTISGEIYSPIHYHDDIFIVRKYSMLDAFSLRNEVVDCPVKKIDIYTRYSGLVQTPNTDIVGNLLISENIAPHLTGFCVEVESQTGISSQINTDQIDELIYYFSRIIPILVRNYKSLSLSKRLWIKILCEYYALKPFCDKIGIDWHPEQYDIDIKSIEDSKRPIVRANKEIIALTDNSEILKKLIELNDPRIRY